MITILGSRQDQFGLGDVAGVDIDRPVLWRIGLLVELVLPLVGNHFGRSDLFGIDQFLKGNQLFLKPSPHRFFVKAGLIEIE